MTRTTTLATLLAAGLGLSACMSNDTAMSNDPAAANNAQVSSQAQMSGDVGMRDENPTVGEDVESPTDGYEDNPDN